MRRPSWPARLLTVLPRAVPARLPRLPRLLRPQAAIKVASALELDNLKNEISLQSMSRHPNIVEYRETYLHINKLWVRRRRGSAPRGGDQGPHGATSAVRLPPRRLL